MRLATFARSGRATIPTLLKMSVALMPTVFQICARGAMLGRAMRFGNQAGGFALIIMPSLDLAIYKMGGNNGPSPR